MSSWNPRPLLPQRQSDARPEPPGPTSGVGPSRDYALQPRRVSVIAACDSCRDRKTKCNGGRPRCSTCSSHGWTCKYNTQPSESRQAAAKRRYEELEHDAQGLRRSHETMQQFIETLTTTGETEAMELVQLLRQGVLVESILRRMQGGDLMLQSRLSPETRLRYEFPYRKEMPAALQVQTNPYLNTLLYESAYLGAQLLSKGGESHPRSDPDRPAAPYVKPYAASRLVDSRLGDIKPSSWTNVSKDDAFLRTALELYFLYEYHFFSGFHRDLFLDDMLSGSEQYCSPLLVNAVLALACNCCRSCERQHDFWNPNKVGYKFFAEARRLWEVAVQDEPNITTVQAGIVMSITYNLYALDKIGTSYCAEAIRLAEKLHLFDLPLDAYDTNYRKWAGDGYTAWNLYFWTTLTSHMLCIPPPIEEPPNTPLPDPEKNPEWYGECWIRYPLDEALYHLQHPHFFKSKCELSIILNRLGKDLFSDDNATAQLSAETLRKHLADLGVWNFSLSGRLGASHAVFPFELNLHLLYLTATINICEKLVDIGGDGDSSIHPPQPTLTHARICFETVLRLYYLRHGFEIPDGHLAHNSAVLAYKGLSQRYLPIGAHNLKEEESISTEEARSTLILAAKALADQGRNYYLPRALLEIVETEIVSVEKNALRQYVTMHEDDSEGLRVRNKYISSRYPVGEWTVRDELNKRRLDVLASGLAELTRERLQSSHTASHSPTGSRTASALGPED